MSSWSISFITTLSVSSSSSMERRYFCLFFYHFLTFEDLFVLNFFFYPFLERIMILRFCYFCNLFLDQLPENSSFSNSSPESISFSNSDNNENLSSFWAGELFLLLIMSLESTDDVKLVVCLL